MEKKEIFDQLLLKMLGKKELVDCLSKTAWQDSIEIDQSRLEKIYDSTVSEKSWLFHAFSLLSKEVRREIEVLKNIDLTPSDTVKVGSIITTKNEKEKTERYFIAPMCTLAGTIIEVNNSGKIIVITPSSPVGTALLGKKEGDNCKVVTPYRTYYLTILEVE
ncbi:MAG TPA: GreA/GreB family elongation factor [Candidatus Pacearchaeota archaeon]|nr:GreA/GreB family elongation factor [Candidatus Pacearchaeota archaeon]